MNEDYLWDKSGKPNVEIERLENALEAFRYKKQQPPVLPENIIPFKKETKKPLNRFFSLPLAVAASLAFVFLSVGFLFALRSEDATNGVATIDFVEIQNGVDDEQLETFPPTGPIEDRKKPPIRKLKRKVVLLPDVIAAKTKVNSEQNLDDESKYALQQLLKALQITNAKLNLVKKKIQNAEGTGPES